MVTSSLTKDMDSKTDVYQANAIRVLFHIIDGSVLAWIRRHFKQAIVDKNPVVASAAVAFNSFRQTQKVVKRWINEVEEAVQSRASLVQFHALALLYQKHRRFEEMD